MRTRIVWVAFAATMTTFGLVFLGGDWAGTPQMVRVAPYADVGTSLLGTADGVLPRNASLSATRWDSIVIHHSGHPLDDHESIAWRHRSQFGFKNLGYHFVIGNGSKGLGDGEAFASDRWDRQFDGAHVPMGNRSDGSELASNDRSIGICLVGNGNVRSFSPAQLDRLHAVVSRLQRACNISDDRVLLASDVSGVTSPGRIFPTLEFEKRLALEH